MRSITFGTPTRRGRLVSALSAAAAFILPTVTASAAYRVVYSFRGGTGDGADPIGSLTNFDGKLYGFTQSGGSGSFWGTIFGYDTSSGTESVLHSFQFGASDGQSPVGTPLIVGNTLYGLTSNGGNTGTVFSYDLASGNEALLHSFTGAGFNGTDGSVPHGSLILANNSLYGTTQQGGSSLLYGTLFKYSLATNTSSLAYSFRGINDGSDPINGSPVQVGDALFGLTNQGGGTNSVGAIYRYSLATGTEQVAYSFGNHSGDGSSPFGSVIGSGTKLYGMTFAGGSAASSTASFGTIFQFDTATGTETVLHSFAGGTADGSGPQGDLLLVGDVLYGMTRYGGIGGTTTSEITGDGVVFSYDLATGTYAILHEFSGGSTDGSNPVGDLTLVGNTLYGMAPAGGSVNDGVIFSLDIGTVPEPSTTAAVTCGAAVTLLRRRRGC